MNEIYIRRVRLVYGILITVITLLLAFLFIGEAVAVYDAGIKSGGQMYSREIVGERLRPLIFPACLWLVAVIGGYVLSVILPNVRTDLRKKRTASVALSRLQKRAPMGEGEEFLAEKRKYDRDSRIVFGVWSAAVLFAVASAIAAVIYLTDPAHFRGDITQETFSLLVNVFPWVGATFVLFLAALGMDAFMQGKRISSLKRMLILGKDAPMAAPHALKARMQSAIAYMGHEKTLLILRVVLLAAAVVLIAFGIWNGGAGDVLKKAINICTECIGLG